MADTYHLALIKNGTEWDRARVPQDYDPPTAVRQIDEWKAKIWREDPDAELEVRRIDNPTSDPFRD